MKKVISFLQQSTLVACCVALLGCAGTEQQQQVRHYETLTLAAQDVTTSQRYSASIRGRQDIDIFPQVSGTITKVCVKEGQVVRRGESLFVIDQVPFDAALKMADANVEAAEAAVATADLVAKSKQKLFDRGVVSEFELQTAKNTLATCKAQLAQAKAAQINASNNYSYTMVKSPADGVVGTIPFRVGTLVSPQLPQPLTTVSDNSTMYVYFSIGENALLDLIAECGSMDKVLASLPEVSLLLNNGKEYAHKGRIESISGVINASTGSVSVRAVFPNKGRTLHSGASGNILLPQRYEQAIVIPKRATFEILDQIYAYKVVDGLAVATKIEVARVSTTADYIVTEGLAAGDEILLEGVALVHNGDRVK
ncbi:MAG: efflux RND transporter periplasmic adaptor subunit [Alistipes sp.]|nr:efflux RND transporter periplasmic adaptor subunit [Alistipes sp.]